MFYLSGLDNIQVAQAAAIVTSKVQIEELLS